MSISQTMKPKKIFLGIVAFTVLVAGLTFVFRSSDNKALAGKYDVFARCLEDKGAVFYGAFWCSHCQAQKKLFGSSAELLPYVECSTSDGRAQTEICIDKNVQSYPTWEFADGTRLSGEIPLETLAEKTSCELPL